MKGKNVTCNNFFLQTLSHSPSHGLGPLWAQSFHWALMAYVHGNEKLFQMILLPRWSGKTGNYIYFPTKNTIFYDIKEDNLKLDTPFDIILEMEVLLWWRYESLIRAKCREHEEWMTVYRDWNKAAGIRPVGKDNLEN